ncbi:MAG: hypothetical protein R3A48_28135 [Polyangiales bacterium]
MNVRRYWLWVVPALALNACSQASGGGGTFDPDASFTDDVLFGDDVVVKVDVVAPDVAQPKDVVSVEDVVSADVVVEPKDVVDTDTGVVDTDTGVVDTDTGMSTDSGVVDTDAGMSTDSGVVDTDAGMSTDSGVVDTDAGMSTDSGAVTAPANDLPANALTLNLATPVVTVMGSTAGATTQGACGAAGEVYYRFTLTRREVVSVNTYGSTYDTTVAFTDAMGAQLTGACNDDSTCGGLQSQYTAVLDAGTYLVAVGGFSSNTGNFVLNFHHLPVGNGPAVQVTNTAAGVRTYTGTTSGTGTVTQSCGGGATGPENTYWFVTCPSFVSTSLTASTCGGATWDTVVEQRSTNRTAAVCSDDGTPGCGVRSRAAGTLAAGAALHAVYVDGFGSGSGDYSVALSFGDCATGQNLCSTACRDLQSDASNCGACGNACPTGQTCNAGVCRVACLMGETLCGSTCVNTASSVTNCGACGTACAAANGTPSCVASACGVASCNAGYGNCDGNAANGCETNTATSVTHCGACGNACATGTNCVAGACVGGAPPNDLAANAIALDLTSPAVTVTSSNANATTQGSCGNAEVYYRFTLTRREVVSVNTFGSGYDTTVALTNATGAQLTGACNDDSGCGGLQSRYTAVLDAGTYLVAVGGFGTNTGAFTLNLHHLPVGNGPATEVTNTAAGVRAYTGTTSGTGTVTQSCGGGAGPENTYWFVTCPSFVSTSLTASTCGGATWDTVVEQRSTNRTAAVCSDDGTPGCGVRSRAAGTLAAGAALHAVYVDGFGSGSGDYSVALSFGACPTGQNLCSTACRDLQADVNNCGTCGNVCAAGQSCVAGACMSAAPANNNFANATALTLGAGETRVTGNTTGATFDGAAGCGTSPNVWYRVTLTGSEVLYADTAGSAYDTRLYLADATGALVANTCNDDAGCSTGGFTSPLQSRFAVVVPAGTYYIAVGGLGSTTVGAFTLNVQHIPVNYGSYFYPTPITGDNTASTVLVGTSARSSTCGGSASGEDTRWFVTCGAQTSLFSLCPRDNGTWTRTIGSTSYDPAMYVFSGATGAEATCNDDATTCAGTGGDTLSYGSRIETTMNRGINMVVVDERVQPNGMQYTLRYVVR